MAGRCGPRGTVAWLLLATLVIEVLKPVLLILFHALPGWLLTLNQKFVSCTEKQAWPLPGT